MGFDLINFASSEVLMYDVNEIEKCNDISRANGLSISHKESIELCETRRIALKNVGRIEFGAGVLEKLITQFSDSPYVTQENFAETLCSLTDVFYYYKNETMDKLSDDDLIDFMKESFNGNCGGSVELMVSNNLEELVKHLKFNEDPNANNHDEEDEEDEDGEC